MTSGVLIGAFERDNFGDILFLSATARLLGDRDYVAAAPFPGDTSILGGARVVPYEAVFETDRPDFVWVVGGENGSTTMQSARTMSSVTDGPGLPDYAAPYIPRASRYRNLSGVPLVINSVGISAAALAVGKRRIELFGALRDATHLSVRDRGSSDLLHRLGIAHRLTPDVVHSLVTPDERTTAEKSREKDVALVQVSTAVLSKMGIVRFAESLCSASALDGMRIRLFLAGTAAGHDSPGAMEELRSALVRRTSADRVEVSTSVTACEKMREIGRSGLWLGTSLHGFILATGFAVPRVGLELHKVSQYSRSWDIQMPAAVAIDDLSAALDGACALVAQASMEDDAARLAAQSDAGGRVAVESLSGVDRAVLARTRETNAIRTAQELSSVTRGAVALDHLRALGARARRFKSRLG